MAGGKGGGNDNMSGAYAMLASELARSSKPASEWTILERGSAWGNSPSSLESASSKADADALNEDKGIIDFNDLPFYIFNEVLQQ